MKQVAAATILLILAAGIGFLCQNDPYRLARVGYPQDQTLLDHRDSPYAHVSWVASESHNYAQLRFFNRVEGGVCLRPSWSELTGVNAEAIRQGAPSPGPLAHLLRPTDWSAPGLPPVTSWPRGRPTPDPGTLANSPYVRLFPLAVLLNDRLLDAAEDDPRRARPDILVVGLGSGVGVSVYAHHFPEASITVVDIDRAVIEMVKGHYPFLAWLATRKTADDRPRLRLTEREAHDARQYIQHAEIRRDGGRRYDVVVLDAYTDGSTIPPHLMTEEFFEDIRALMPDDGILLANLIGSYTGPQRLLLGGAIRSMMAAGLPEVHNFPILRGDAFVPEDTRNNIVLASSLPLDPERRKAAWRRLRSFTPWPEFAEETYTTHELYLIGSDRRPASTAVGLLPAAPADRDETAALIAELERSITDRAEDKVEVESDLASRLAAFVRRRHPEALGWEGTGARMLYHRIDWVLQARATWRHSLEEAGATTSGRRYKHAGTTLVIPPGAEPGESGGRTIPDAPLFTDARPNADIYNR